MKSKTSATEKREPLFHIVKRDQLPLEKSILIRVIAIVCALLFAGLLTFILTGVNPVAFFSKMWIGAFGTGKNFLVTLKELAILLCMSVAVTPAFRMRFWNTGAEGQVIAGCLATAACMFYFQDWSLGILIPVMLVSALVAGAVWGVIPAVFKALFGTNETLFTLMMNYVAMRITRFFMNMWNKRGSTVDFTKLDPQQRIGSFFGGNRMYLIPFFVVIAVTFLMYGYLRYHKHGYEISVVGESENTARYIGINVKKVIIRTMALSGLLCGLAGFLLVGTAQNVSPDIAGGRGFTAIMVSWLAKFNPIIMILASLLIVVLQLGSLEIATELRVDPSFPDLITGIILFFIIGCEFFVQYKIIFNHQKHAEKEEKQ